MPESVAPVVLELMRARLQAAGLPASDGQRQELRPASLLIGQVCDEQPLFCSEAALAVSAPDRLLRGLAAAGLLCGVERMALAVDAEQPAALGALRRAASGTRVEIWPVEPRVPLSADDLFADLRARQTLASALDVLVLDAVALSDLAQIMSGRPVTERVVSVCGLVQRPAVLSCTLGSPCGELLRQTGGSQDPACVLLHNGALGDPIDSDHPIELHTRGLLVLPHDHPLLAARSVPVADELRRAASACVNCRACSDRCSAHLLGAKLQPHHVLLATASAWRQSQLEHCDELLGALECRGCHVCTAVCPSGLRPGVVVSAVARELRARQVGGAAGEPRAPLAERVTRRLSRRGWQERLGLKCFTPPTARLGGTVLPDRLRVAAHGPDGTPRVPVVRAGDSVCAGDLLALAPAGSRELDCVAPAAGTVTSVDADEGIELAVR